MSRPLRIEFEGAWYHVINRGANKQDIFYQPQDYYGFLDLLAKCRKMWALETHAYCLMKNHYHLLIRTPRGNLSRAMRHLDGVYTQYFNRSHQRDGPLFRGRYKAILVDAENYLLQVVRYIHLNPVKAKLVNLPENFPWSSYATFLNLRNPPAALERNIVLSYFGQQENAIEQMREFTLAGIDEETEKFYGRERHSAIWAKEKFMAKIKSMISQAGPASTEIPTLSDLIQKPPAIESIMATVAQSYEIPKRSILEPDSSLSRKARGVAIYLCRNLGGWPLLTIGNAFGDYQDSSISSVVARMTKKLKKDNLLQSHLSELEKAILQIETKKLTGNKLRNAET